jgi:hypothetical protein
MRIFNLGEATKYSSLTFIGSITRGLKTINHTANFVATLSAERGVERLIATSLEVSFTELYGKALRELTRHRLSRIANNIIGTEVEFTVVATFGDLKVVAGGGLLDGPPLVLLPGVLNSLATGFASEMFAEIQKANAAKGFAWDSEKQGYAKRRRRSIDIADILAADLQRRFGGRFTVVRPGDPLGFGDIFGQGGGIFGAGDIFGPEAIFGAEDIFGPGGIFSSRGGFRNTDAPDDQVPAGSYRCRHCDEVHTFDEVVANLKKIRQELGHLDVRQVIAFYPPEVLAGLIADNMENVPWGYYPCLSCPNFHQLETYTYWDAASREVRTIPRGRYPTHEGGLADIPEGWFWNISTRELSEIPEGKFLHDDGELDDCPEGTRYDYTFKCLVATERGKYWDVEKEVLIDIPSDSYVNPDGALVPVPANTTFNYDKNRLVATLAGHYFNQQTYAVQAIPEGSYLTAEGELDTLADGLYPDADGNLHEIPTGQRWNTATGALEPASISA